MLICNPNVNKKESALSKAWAIQKTVSNSSGVGNIQDGSIYEFGVETERIDSVESAVAKKQALKTKYGLSLNISGAFDIDIVRKGADLKKFSLYIDLGNRLKERCWASVRLSNSSTKFLAGANFFNKRFKCSVFGGVDSLNKTVFSPIFFGEKFDFVTFFSETDLSGSTKVNLSMTSLKSTGKQSDRNFAIEVCGEKTISDINAKLNFSIVSALTQEDTLEFIEELTQDTETFDVKKISYNKIKTGFMPCIMSLNIEADSKIIVIESLNVKNLPVYLACGIMLDSTNISGNAFGLYASLLLGKASRTGVSISIDVSLLGSGFGAKSQFGIMKIMADYCEDYEYNLYYLQNSMIPLKIIIPGHKITIESFISYVINSYVTLFFNPKLTYCASVDNFKANAQILNKNNSMEIKSTNANVDAGIRIVL